MCTHCIDRRHATGEKFGDRASLAALDRVLSNQEIDTICRQLGHTWRRRALSPAVTVKSMVYRGLHPDKSIATTLTDLAAASGDPKWHAPTDAAWCQARSRLPKNLWPTLIDTSAQRLIDIAGQRHRYHGRPVYIADGSSVSMPDTPSLVRAFGYADTRHGPSRFPVARLTAIVLSGVEAVVDYRLDHYRSCEDDHFHQMWHRLPSGCICLCDRRFCSFYNFAKLSARSIDLLTRLHSRRRPEWLIAAGQRLGPGEWLVNLNLAPHLRKRYVDPSLPEVLTVRLIRVRFTRGQQRRVLWLVTTLLDASQYTRHSLIALYRRRWGIETRIGSLKTTLKLNVLRSKTAANVRSEVAATVLAHNLVWTLIHQAVENTRVPADRVSFTGAVRTIVTFSPTLRQTTGFHRFLVYLKMLHHIRRQTNRWRPNRVEPRLVKRNLRRYSFLKIPRAEARLKCLS